MVVTVILMIMAVAGVVIVVVVGHGGSGCASVLWKADLGEVSWDQIFKGVVECRYFNQCNHHREAIISNVVKHLSGLLRLVIERRYLRYPPYFR